MNYYNVRLCEVIAGNKKIIKTENDRRNIWYLRLLYFQEFGKIEEKKNSLNISLFVYFVLDVNLTTEII